MSILAKQLRSVLALAIAAVLALVAPASAVADVVTVEARSSGVIEPNPIVMATLGLTDPGSGPLPFDLYVTVFFNSDSAGYIDLGSYVVAPESNVDIDLRIGDQRYQNLIAGSANVDVYNVGAGDKGHQLQAGFNPPESSSNSFQVTQWVTGPAALIGPAQPLVPRVIFPNPNLQGHVDLAAYPLNPDAPGAWHMTADTTSFSVEIKTAVPEPTSAAMLGAGLLALGVWRRRMKR